MKRKNLCNSCNNQKINWCDELKEHAMRGFYDCEWYSEKKEESNERCAKCIFANLDNEHGVLYCTVTEAPVTNDGYCLTFKPIEHNPDKKEYIGPLMTKEEMCVNCVFCEMNNGVTYCAVTGGTTETDGYCLTFKKEKDEYIDPLVTKEEMASVVAEIKSESYPKLTRLIQYLMCEYLVEDIQIERVFEAGEDFYRAKLKYKEFPF